jgi:caa(3)-type oxidase subunit IV
MDNDTEQRLYTQIYAVLITLTLASVGASLFLKAGRLAAIAVALSIAWLKAGLIGYHYMHLKSEKPVVWVVVFIALTAVVILAIGVLPDLAIYPS